MNFLDILILICLGYNIIIGIKKGAVRMISSISGIFIALYLSKNFSPILSIFLNDASPKIPSSPYIHFGIFFMLTLAFLYILTEVIHSLLKWSGIGIINHTLGGGLGLIRGILLSLLFVAPLYLAQFNIAQNSLILTDAKPFINMTLTQFNKSPHFSNLFESLKVQQKKQKTKKG
ncbi:hypothetical protein DID78_05000 [Candidatus Marinamargulisbacteria bacterium SCGC AG-343-D04]|nr:hypothetical protein DID78_05000 [Candidatus Marinamargulisbacteria bacterium SCGC AG-343-D04]